MGKTAIQSSIAAEPSASRGARLETLATLVLIWLAAISFALVAVMSIQRVGDPGYDFRYFWLAGHLWADGVSPYGPVFGEAGARLVAEGHVPEIWPYPPNLWLPTIGLSPFSLMTAWNIWLVLQAAALAGASAVLAFGLPAGMIPGAASRPKLTRLSLFGLHLTLAAAMEATHFAVYSGQSALFVYLGAAVLITALAHGRHGLAVAGLVVVCMKPQIGAIVAVGLVLSGRQGMRIVLVATLASVLLIVPPMIVRPTVLFDWLHTLGAYDGVTLANRAVSMTGIRHLVWVAAKTDIGNIPAMGIALAVGVFVAVRARASAARDRADPARAAIDLVVAEMLVVLAFAPLHIYDFVVIGIGGLVLLGARGPALAAAVLAIVFVLKPTDLYLVLHGGKFVTLFPGSTFATISALILLLVAIARRPVASG